MVIVSDGSSATATAISLTSPIVGHPKGEVCQEPGPPNHAG